MYVVVFFSITVLPNRGYSQFSLVGMQMSYMYSAHTHSVSGGMRSINMLLGKPTRYSPELNLLGFDYLEADPYNNNLTNCSLLPLYELGWLAFMALPTIAITGDEARRNQWFYAVLFAPTLLSNSRHGYLLYMEGLPDKTPWWISLVASSKIDFFNGNNTVWWRYRPAIGVEYGIASEEEFGVSAYAGISYMLDVGKTIKPQSQLQPQLGVQCVFGSFKREGDAVPR